MKQYNGSQMVESLMRDAFEENGNAKVGSFAQTCTQFESRLISGKLREKGFVVTAGSVFKKDKSSATYNAPYHMYVLETTS